VGAPSESKPAEPTCTVEVDENGDTKEVCSSADGDGTGENQIQTGEERTGSTAADDVDEETASTGPDSTDDNLVHGELSSLKKTADTLMAKSQYGD